MKSGDVVRVKVLEVDEPRKRISLTLRLDDEPGAAAKPERGEKGGARREPGRDAQGRGDQGRGGKGRGEQGGRGGQDRRGGKSGQQGRGADRGRAPAPAANNAMADALRRAGFDVEGPDKKR